MKKGFIATSLIYSFFLAFLVILLAILSSYIVNNRIMDYFNQNVEKKLSSHAYIPEIYSKGNNCYVQVNEDNDILELCFNTYNMASVKTAGDDYVCFFSDNEENSIYSTKDLIIDDSPYSITCQVRNKNIDTRYLNSAITNIYVVYQLGGDE